MTKQLTPLRRKDQATGYQAAVRDIVTWLLERNTLVACYVAQEIECKFGEANVDQRLN